MVWQWLIKKNAIVPCQLKFLIFWQNYVLQFRNAIEKKAVTMQNNDLGSDMALEEIFKSCINVLS